MNKLTKVTGTRHAHKHIYILNIYIYIMIKGIVFLLSSSVMLMMILEKSGPN